MEAWGLLQAKLAKVPVARAKRQKRDGALTWEVPPPLDQARQFLPRVLYPSNQIRTLGTGFCPDNASLRVI